MDSSQCTGEERERGKSGSRMARWLRVSAEREAPVSALDPSRHAREFASAYVRCLVCFSEVE